MNQKKVGLYIFQIACLAVIYHLAARLGLQMAYVQQNTSPVWPPSGIGLAALLLFGIRFWPGITLGVVIGSILTGAPVGLSLGLGVANTLEALLGSYLLQGWIGFHPALDRIKDVVGLALAATASTAVSATIGVSTLFIFNEIQAPFFTLWIIWWVGNLLGMLVVTPFLLVWVRRFPRFWNSSRLLELAFFLILLIFVGVYVFGNQSGPGALHQALIYVIFPFAIWAALRLEQIGAVTTIFIISGIAIWGTIHELGPFSQLPLNESLILLQTFTAVVSLTTLTLACSASERKTAESALRRQVTNLEALNDASKVFLSNLEKKALYESICRLVVERLHVSSAWIHLKDPKIEEQSSEVVYPPDFQPKELRSSTQLVAVFPLQYAGEVIGELNVSSEELSGFSKEQQLLLESYANLAAVAIQNSWLFDQVRLGSEQLHALSHRLMEVQEEERRNLSRELHDESGQILSALMVRLGLLERDAEAPDQIRAHVAELKIIVAEVLNNLHNLAVKLRPASLDRLGLITALQQYIDEYSRQHHLDVQLETIGVEPSSRLPGEIETAFFRIIQESLTNVALHAKATRVDMLLNRRNDCLVMVIEDNGIGFNPIPLADENRLGLFGMRERIEMLGGKLIIESSHGKGTTISVEVPYANSSTHSG